jgi:hypothetical protein
MQTNLPSAPAERGVARSGAPETRLTRRSLFPPIAAAVALGAVGGPVNAAPYAGPHPDAELLALGARWLENVVVLDPLVEAALDLEEEYEERRPNAPEAAFYRDGDEDLIPFSSFRRADGRCWYANVRERLRKHQADSDAGKARVDEILAAFDEWDRSSEAAREAYGLTAARAAYQPHVALNNDLRARIAGLPARTFEGLLVKARVVRWVYNGEQELEELLADAIDEKGGVIGGPEPMDVSLLLDLARLAAGGAHV